jgi:hypothetical protein
MPANINRMTEALPETSKPVTVNVTCRNCIFFKKEAYFSGDGKNRSPCEQLGRLGSQLPCPIFKVDPYSVDFNGPSMMAFANILSDLPAKSLPLMAAILLQERTTRRNGFTFGQTVYVRVYPDDYISNYATAKVVMVDDKWVYIQAKRGFRAKIQHSSVFREAEWAQHQLKLRSAGKFTDPNLKNYTSVNYRPTLTETRLQTVDSHGFALPMTEGAITNDFAPSPKTGFNQITTQPPPKKRGRPRRTPSSF